MSFNRRLDSIFPGMGQPLRNDALYLQTGIALTTAGSGTPVPIPATGVLIPTTTAGRIRLKIYNGGGTTPTITALSVTASDGTNSILLAQSIVAPNRLISATSWLEFEFEYILDVATAAGAGGGAIGQLLSSIGGANAFALNYTLTGTTGTASLDVEIAPLI